MQINTSCRSCVFASFTENTQQGCDLGLLEKFQKAGAEIKEQAEEGTEFFVIKGRVCPSCRPKEWAEEHQGEDLVQLARKERALRLHVVIPVMHTTYDAVWASVESLASQKLPPSKVTVALNQEGMVSSQFIQHLRGKPFPWSVFTCLERELGQRVGETRLIDLVAPEITTPFYMVLKPGEVLPPDTLSKIDSYLNDEMGRFSLLESPQFYVVPKQLHDHLTGNHMVTAGDGEGEEIPLGSLVEKIRWAARLENQPHMVKQYSELGV